VIQRPFLAEFLYSLVCSYSLNTGEVVSRRQSSPFEVLCPTKLNAGASGAASAVDIAEGMAGVIRSAAAGSDSNRTARGVRAKGA
jgi:hypothetical protein